MFLFIVIDKTAHFDRLKSNCHVFLPIEKFVQVRRECEMISGSVYPTVNTTVVSEHAHLRSHSFRDVVGVH